MWRGKKFAWFSKAGQFVSEAKLVPNSWVRNRLWLLHAQQKAEG